MNPDGKIFHSALFHILQTPATLFGKSHHSALSYIRHNFPLPLRFSSYNLQGFRLVRIEQP